MRGDVIWVDSAGRARLDWPWCKATSRDRVAGMAAALDRVRQAAQPPARVSPEIIAAPARLHAVAETPRETVMTENGPRIRRSSPVGFDRVRCGDAFDRMHDQARRRHAGQVAAAVRAGKPGPAFVPPFSPGQETAGRDYAALAERCAASGVKCSSVEATRVSGGGISDREVAMLRDFDRLRAMQRRIGGGIAKDVLRPSKGGMRHPIRVRRLVDQVCLGGMCLEEICKAHGWGANARIRLVLQASLCAALDRMQGYGLVRTQNVA